MKGKKTIERPTLVESVFFTEFDYMFNDILHSDGSKTYDTLHYGPIKIMNPEFIKLIEYVLSKNYRGFSYIPVILEFVESGKDINNEFENVLRILD